MDQESLVSELVDAGAELVRRFDCYMPVAAAFWLKPAGDERWWLYIASERIDGTSFDLGYGEILRLASEIRDPSLDPFRVKLIGIDDALARGVLDLYRRYPGRLPTRYGGPILGGVGIDGAYIYPLPASAAIKP